MIVADSSALIEYYRRPWLRCDLPGVPQWLVTAAASST